MKKAICFLLTFSVLLTTFSGCVSHAKKTETPNTAAAAQAAEPAHPTAAPTTEPTLSPEEQLLASLPRQMVLSYELGIADLDILADLDREITIGEALQMLQKAYFLGTGTESKLIADARKLDYLDEPAYLGWIGRLPSALWGEYKEGEHYQNFTQWLSYCTDSAVNDGRLTPEGEQHFYTEDENNLVAAGYHWYDIGWNNMGNFFFQNVPEGNPLLDECRVTGALLAWTMLMHDRTTGEKILDCGGYNTLPVEQVLTVEEMASMAVRVSRAFPQAQELLPYDACLAYDDTILTPELLSRETDLPDASCSSLPTTWHGVAFDDYGIFDPYGFRTYDGPHPTMEIYEYEIQAMKEAGFNYVGLQLDFSWLLGGLNRPNTNDGMMDAECLRKLDQILAWCMERDMHLDIRCISVGGFVYSQQACWTPDENGARRYAEVWEVLANRYRDIPNTYLSFTVLDQVFQNWGNQSDGGFVFEANMRWLKQRQAVDFLKPAVEAIRSVTPDRCIIADLSSFFGSGDDILELNVAISTDIYAENRFFLPLKNDVEDPSYFSSLQWPYEGTVDAQAMLEGVFFYNARSVNELSAFAREHGLGFMVSGWGMFPLSSPYYPAYRISDETYHAFLTDMTQALEGTSWCYENRYGTSGITTAVPLVKNVTYEQMEDYPLYYDTAMLGWFQEINGVT